MGADAHHPLLSGGKHVEMFLIAGLDPINHSCGEISFLPENSSVDKFSWQV
jgi:hypothetical protein